MIEEFKLHAQKEYPKEACGFVLKNNTYIPVCNISNDAENYFKIDPKEYLKYASDVIAVFHSHTKGTEVSAFDIISCNNTFLPWIVYIMPDRFEIIYPEKYQGDKIIL